MKTIQHNDYLGLLASKVQEVQDGKRTFVTYKNAKITYNGKNFVVRHKLLMYPIEKATAEQAANFVHQLLNFQSMTRQLKRNHGRM